MTIAAQSVTTATSRKGQITGWHVLIGVVTFFALIIAVDVVFMVLAYRTFSGQVASNPYEAGLAFNKTLAQREREAALGWAAAVETVDGDAVIVRVRDRAGRPLDRLSLTGSLARPATEVGKQTLNFKPLGDGRYRATARLGGAWDLRATARDAQNAFELEARLVSQ
ncbi:FixH family protein [Caulobacter vibrioides]|uniref:Ferredoxin, putative n=2 Tax=Caulobacter vibrioides TaxID=155892 RepID=Q9A8E8_CAUVC|nr:FixH family protein [Caulobacter vibrioides]YP_002516845.1 cation pump-linked membrane protein fixH [Caulobacter vibrioides NA1000]AAK23387.1 ferredoxin, putative [Caulobacter vibrioides CB15]ACL94937.1 cation pump-linked membrane protein fixH [Caulobacter vibrioides NA1000]ATC28215.1 ferredoxin [Caulobacter vibrioides]QXZ53481.1 FixH family protein [Caulobacter vibrioides]